MNDRFDQGSLEFEVSNFGPIVEAKIELRPLTVFVGPSNTGKSYLAILIYALHRYFSARGWPGHRRFPASLPMFRRSGNERLSRKTVDLVLELAKQVVENKRSPRSDEGILLPKSIVEIIRSGLSELGDHVGNEIGRCFGIQDTGALIRKGTGDTADIVCRWRNVDHLASIDHVLTISAHGRDFNTTIPGGTELRLGVGNVDHPMGDLLRIATEVISFGDRDQDNRSFWAWRMIEALTANVRPRILGFLDLPAFYLPADRTGVMHAHNVVVSALIESAAMAGLRPVARTPMLSGVLADFLEQLIELDRSRYGRRKPVHDLGTPIEEAILGGSVGVDRSEVVGHPQFTYRPEGWQNNLSLMNASSMVSELAPVVLYLRHVVVRGNLLIVEEPESHLHPAMQVELTRQLAALVHVGIRVIVTTHSEWVLEELANVVRRSALPMADREKTANGKFALQPHEVGAWLFQPKRRPRGSIVKEVCLDDSGIFPSGFDDVAVALHNDWADLSNRIGEAE